MDEPFDGDRVSHLCLLLLLLLLYRSLALSPSRPSHLSPPGTGEATTSSRSLPRLPRCYRAYTNKFSFDEAAASCRSHGTQLVSLVSAAETDFVETLVAATSQGPAPPVWIGLRRANLFEAFRWTDSALLGTAQWATGEPDASAGLCATLESTAAGARWAATSCDRFFGFVCKGGLVTGSSASCACLGEGDGENKGALCGRWTPTAPETWCYTSEVGLHRVAREPLMGGTGPRVLGSLRGHAAAWWQGKVSHARRMHACPCMATPQACPSATELASGRWAVACELPCADQPGSFYDASLDRCVEVCASGFEYGDTRTQRCTACSVCGGDTYVLRSCDLTQVRRGKAARARDQTSGPSVARVPHRLRAASCTREPYADARATAVPTHTTVSARR